MLSQVTVPDNFVKIPDSLHFRDSLYKFIIPNKKYIYWRVLRKDDSLNNELIYESKKNKEYSKSYSPNNGFFWECMPDGCFTYILAYRNKRLEYVTNEKALRDFIGYVDNLSEALLIARTYDLWFDDQNPIGGSYQIDENYIYLYLSKFKSCPVSREAFFVKINRKTGNFEQESKGLYYKTNDCYTS